MKLKNFVFVLLLFLSPMLRAQQKSYNISGFIKESGSQETMIGATVFLVESKQGVTTNNYGFYSISTNLDSVTLWVSMVGYQKQAFRIAVDKNIELNISLESNNQISEVIIQDSRNRISSDQQMSIIRLPVEDIKSIPTLMGEKDVLKVLQLMPGVQKGSEGNSGLYVRGGGPDQNLIILDDAPVYNAFHLFGFFSLFNGDALKSIELTKGGFPARYGGRLSSVLDMNMKDGNKEELKGEFGIGAIASRFVLEGPIIKNKSSFLISARRTYIDALVAPFLPTDAKAGYYFYDLNAKLNYEIDNKNKLFLSGYFGRDKFYVRENYEQYKSNFGLYWGNGTGTLRWNHLYNSKLFSNTSFIYSQYRFNIFINEKYNNEDFSIRLYSGIRDITLKHDFDYAWRPGHSIKTGILVQQHRFTPSATTIKNESFTDENIDEAQLLDALETGIYIEDHFQYKNRFQSNIGFRVSTFLTGEKNYMGIEPRIGMSYQLKEDLALKASYSLMNQYIHLLSSTGIGLPTDLWVPSTENVKPQRSNQVALGLAKDFIPKNYSISLEGYYKKMDNVIAYKEGASFLGLEEPGSGDKITWEENITSGQAWSYGAELLLRKTSGKFTGWVGYTLSWTQLQFDEINFGEKYFARYDRRHDISVVGIYKPTENSTIAFTWVYGTGNAITLPKAEYAAPVHQPGVGTNNSNQIYSQYVNDYGSKNDFRMEAYHRMDLSFQVHKQLKRSIRTIDISFYNVYNRKNPYFYYMGYSDTSNKRVLKKITLFPILPSISWSYKF